MTVTGVQFAHLDWRGEPLRLEYQWVGPAASARPVVVFLHEGLGSLAMWKDFPAAFCAEHSFRGLVFSRHGYGQSTPKPSLERWPPSFMHIQAHDEYGSLEQIRRILRRLPKAERLVLPRCGHAPHRDQPATLSLQAARFIRQDARLHRDRLTAS